jgi:hypothetical protein
MESTERFECPQISLLNHILRIVFIAQQPSGQIVGCIKMGQQRFFKRGQVLFLASQCDVGSLGTGSKQGIATI